jgi:restriction system protein
VRNYEAQNAATEPPTHCLAGGNAAMPIPNFQLAMLPVLKVLDDQHVHAIKDVIAALSTEFSLTPEELAETLETSGQSRFANRVQWAISYLSQGALIERTGRGMVRITQRGLNAIDAAERGMQINTAYLEQFPEYQEFRQRSKTRVRTEAVADSSPEPQMELVTDPAEAIEANYRSLRAALAGELLMKIKVGSPQFFERLVLDLLVAMGYGGSRIDAAQAIGGSGDEGVDGIIKEDKLGLDSIYLQAKRWENPVGRPVVQGFAGSLEGHRARKGVFITTSKFSQDARDCVQRIEKRIVLIDGEQLTNLMIDHGVGVADVAV